MLPSSTFRCKAFVGAFLALAGSLSVVCLAASRSQGRDQDRENEIIANLAAGRVIVHVARDGNIIFAAVDQPIEAGSVPPRVMDLDGRHIAVLLGASEWRLPADPKPVRLDRDFHRLGTRDQRYGYSQEAEPDLELIGIAFLEKLRPLVAQLHHKLDMPADDPLFELVIIGHAPDNYGPEVWTVEYRIQQQQVATRGEYWQTQILRPRFTQLYPPEKKAPRTIVEARYPENLKAPRLTDLIQGNDPRIAQLIGSEPRFAKVVDAVEKGQAQKAVPADATDFLRAILPLVSNNARFVLGTIEEQHGFDWVVPPEEPVEKAKKDDKDRPPDAPTLRRRPQP